MAKAKQTKVRIEVKALARSINKAVKAAETAVKRGEAAVAKAQKAGDRERLGAHRETLGRAKRALAQLARVQKLSRPTGTPKMAAMSDDCPFQIAGEDFSF